MSEQTETLELKLTKEQMEYIIQQSGAKNAEEALISNINLNMIKEKIVQIVPQLSDAHKDDLKKFIAKKFQLEIPTSK